ncbi:MAG: hypothetical protein LWW79_13300 [Holophagaceae bacterium]|nr:hypothetical protein [Holophagaceae bacterium]
MAERITMETARLRSLLVALQDGLMRRVQAGVTPRPEADWDALFQEAFHLSIALEQLPRIEAALGGGKAPTGRSGPGPHRGVVTGGRRTPRSRRQPLRLGV